MDDKQVKDEKFSLDSIEKTFASYKKGQMFDGVVLIKRNDGAIFNIGGNFINFIGNIFISFN